SETLHTNLLVCLRDSPTSKGQRLCWSAEAENPEVKNGEVYFEGAPIIRDGRVYAVTTTYGGGQAITQIQCYALDLDSETPAPAQLLWKQDVCTIKEERVGNRYRHYLLTLAGRNLVYATHSGAIVAIDALTGRHVWARRYASRGPKPAPDRPSRRDIGS